MSRSSPLEGRASGVLLHPTSLPGRGVGEIGAPARRFVDWLAGAGQRFWQVLPLVPVDEGGSPYNGLSALAGNPLLLDLDDLVADGLLTAGDVADPDLPADAVDYARLVAWKEAVLARAHEAFRAGSAPELAAPFREFRERNRGWLEDYALFRALRTRFEGAPWTRWDEPIRDRDPGTLRRWAVELEEEVERHALLQFLFDRQWSTLRQYAAGRGVRIIGDVPIFVAHDSADVWAHRDLFELDEAGEPTVVAGVPPDYFSETGQRWGNPLYRWERMRERGYRWWIERFRRTLEMVDVARIDHFRGFESYWEIPADEETAVQGKWRPGPADELFHALEKELGELPLIAEDLGLITREVEELRDRLELPGMRVLQFGFDGDPENLHLPENYPVRSVAYTGTHDNDTVLGWWAGADDEQHAAFRKRSDESEGSVPEGEASAEVHWSAVRLVQESSAELAVFPLQDILGLGAAARMNTPGRTEGNWRWRFRDEDLAPEPQARLRELTRLAGRG